MRSIGGGFKVEVRPQGCSGGHDQQADKGSDEYPRAHQADVVGGGALVAALGQTRNTLHRAERQSQSGGGPDEVDCAVEIADEPHAACGEKFGGDFAPHHRHEDIKSLYATEDTGVLQDAPERRRAVVLCRHDERR